MQDRMIPDTGSKDTGYWIFEAGCWIFVTRTPQPATPARLRQSGGRNNFTIFEIFKTN